MVLMSGGFVINDVVWEFHETTLSEHSSCLAIHYKPCYNFNETKTVNKR